MILKKLPCLSLCLFEKKWWNVIIAKTMFRFGNLPGYEGSALPSCTEWDATLRPRSRRSTCFCTWCRRTLRPEGSRWTCCNPWWLRSEDQRRRKAFSRVGLWSRSRIQRLSRVGLERPSCYPPPDSRGTRIGGSTFSRSNTWKGNGPFRCRTYTSLPTAWPRWCKICNCRWRSSWHPHPPANQKLALGERKA